MRRGKKLMLTDYLERGIEVAVITSRLSVRFVRRLAKKIVFSFDP